MDNLFTCVTCNVSFKEGEKQRAHYKSDWHRYNLKRKVADLAPVSAQVFAERVQLQKTQVENAKNEALIEFYCKICSKHFSSKNSYENHVQSKKHKEQEMKTSKGNEESNDNDKKIKSPVRNSSKIPKSPAIDLINHENEVEEDSKNWEDIAENEDIEIDESKGIDLKTCLFCEYKASSVETKCEHMASEHSFFIPDSENVRDLEGLLKFLGVKLGCYHVCLWCSNKCYPSLKSVQQHTFDKGHSKMKFEGDTLYEYADFYSYDDNDTENYESDSDSDASESVVDEVNRFVEDDNYELCLPSGIRIGHRSLFRYYKQNFGHRNLELKQYNNYSLKDKYKALGYNSTLITHHEIKAKRKDLAKLQRWKNRMHENMAFRANQINMKHFRRQDINF